MRGLRPRLALAATLCLLLVLPCGLAAQEPRDGTPGDAPAADVAPKFELHYSDGRLGLTARDAPFGEVLGAVANAAGFEAAISPALATAGITTKFRGIPLERGLLRLFKLMGTKNYFIHYGPDGSISKVEIHSGPKGMVAKPIKKPKAAPRPAAPTTGAPVSEPGRMLKSPAPGAPVLRTTTIPARPRPVARPPEPEEPEEAGEEYDEKFFKDPAFFDIVPIAPTPATPAPAEPPAEEEDEIIEEPPVDDGDGDGGDGGDGDGGDGDGGDGGTGPPPDEVIEEEIDPEGPMPDIEQLLDAPYLPPTGEVQQIQ